MNANTTVVPTPVGLCAKDVEARDLVTVNNVRTTVTDVLSTTDGKTYVTVATTLTPSAGDTVTFGGIDATVNDVTDGFVAVEIDSLTRLTVNRA